MSAVPQVRCGDVVLQIVPGQVVVQGQVLVGDGPFPVGNPVVHLLGRRRSPGDDGTGRGLGVLGLALKLRNRRNIVAGLRMGLVRPGHALFRHKITSRIVCPCGAPFIRPALPRGSYWEVSEI